MTRMFIPLSFLCWTTQSIAAMTCVTSTPPSAVADLEADDPRVGRDAAVATPARRVRRVESCPAIRPAMNVPCPFVSRYVRFGACDSSDRSGP